MLLYFVRKWINDYYKSNRYHNSTCYSGIVWSKDDFISDGSTFSLYVNVHLNNYSCIDKRGRVLKLFLCICVQNLDIYSIFKRTVSRGRYCSKKVNPRHRLVCIQSMFYLYVKETKNYIVFHLPKDFKFKSFLKFKD